VRTTLLRRHVGIEKVSKNELMCVLRSYEALRGVEGEQSDEEGMYEGEGEREG
jgi:hypothetical protein